GRRDQPGARQGTERAAGSDAGAAGHDRPGNPPGTPAVPGHGHPEPDRERGHVSVARGAGGPVHDEGARGVSEPHRGVRDRRAGARVHPRPRLRHPGRPHRPGPRHPPSPAGAVLRGAHRRGHRRRRADPGAGGAAGAAGTAGERQVTGPPDKLLRRLEWHVVRRLDGRLQGAYRTVFRGAGMDFTGLREYTLEDDVRHIDWNVTARLDEPYVRQYTEDRELTAWLVLDRSASMRFGGPGKDSVLVDLAVCLGRIFIRAGNRVGAVLYDNRYQRMIPPRAGRSHLLYLTHELTGPAAPEADGHGTDGQTTDLAAMLHLAAATARRRSLVFVISDFIGDLDWVPALTR